MRQTISCRPLRNNMGESNLLGGVQYDRAHVAGTLDYRRAFGGTGGTGSRVSLPIDITAEFGLAQDDPLLLALHAKLCQQAEDEAIRFYAKQISTLGDF